MTAALDYLASMLTDPWLMGGISIGAGVLVLAVWLLRDETRRQRPDRHAASHCTHPEPWMAACPCGWESRPQPSERDARTAYDRHVIAELERIS